jgi:hypothetical protein
MLRLAKIRKSSVRVMKDIRIRSPHFLIPSQDITRAVEHD